MTYQPGGSDPFDQLRRSNPVDADDLPSDSYARIRANVMEAMAMETEVNKSDRRTGNRQPRWRGIGLAAGGLAVAALAVALIVGPGATPAVVPSPTGGAVAGSCVETYSLATLANRGVAFDGTVTAIAGDQVTFSVNERYAGSGGSSVTMTATGMTGTEITSAGGPSLVVGERYLVAGEDQFVWACGFTQPYDPAVAAQWAGATGG